jgi:DNA-binding NtrC family response regulator
MLGSRAEDSRAGRVAVRVLVVDDDDSLRRALPRILREFDVVVAATASDALALLAERPVDAVLTDYGIAPMDGVRLLREIAATYPAIRRYLMSGFDHTRFEEHVASGLVLQMFAKPVDIAALKSALSGTQPVLHG